MTRWSKLGVVAGHAALLAFASPASAQRLREAAAGIARAPAAPDGVVPKMPLLGLVALSGGGALGGAVSGGTLGLAIDYHYCKRHHIETVDFIFKACSFYTAAATPIGWFGGSVVGATTTAAIVAHSRGCPTRAAVLRSFAGAALGAAPGAIMVAGHPEHYPPSRSALIMATPFLSGAGAALAVAGCIHQ